MNEYANVHCETSIRPTVDETWRHSISSIYDGDDDDDAGISSCSSVL